MRKIRYLLIGGIVAVVCGYLFGGITLMPFFLLLFVGGEPINRLPLIEWIIDHPYIFFIWYGVWAMTGLLLGAIRGYQFQSEKLIKFMLKILVISLMVSMAGSWVLISIFYALWRLGFL